MKLGNPLLHWTRMYICKKFQISILWCYTNISRILPLKFILFSRYRLIGDPKKKNFDAKSCPVMGIHLALRKGGNVKLGDIVEVAWLSLLKKLTLLIVCTMYLYNMLKLEYGKANLQLNRTNRKKNIYELIQI